MGKKKDEVFYYINTFDKRAIWFYLVITIGVALTAGIIYLAIAYITTMI